MVVGEVGSQLNLSSYLMHLFLSTPSSPAIMAMTLILYMWSAILSGPETPFLIQPVRFVAFKLCRMLKKSIALAEEKNSEEKRNKKMNKK